MAESKSLRCPIDTRCKKLGKVQCNTIPTLHTLHKWLKGSDKFTGCPHCRAVYETLALVRHVYQLYGLTETTHNNEALGREFDLLHLLSERRELLPYLKYKTAAIFSWGMGQELPPFPGGLGTPGPHLIGGTYYQFSAMMQKRAIGKIENGLDGSVSRTKAAERSVRQHAWSFFYSMLMLKKGLPRPGRLDLQEAIVKAYQTMTTADDRSYSRMLAIDSCKKKCEAIVSKMFRKHDWTRQQMAWPSQSAHCRSGVKEGGALGHLRKSGVVDVKVSWTPDREERRVSEEDEKVTWMRISDETSEDLCYAQAMLVKMAGDEKKLAIPQSLPEPLKIRIVTKGPEFTYSALKPVQEMMFRTLSKDARFMIGEPMSKWKVKNTLGQLRSWNSWVSGDYKAATDNLAIELSYAIAQKIAEVTDMPRPYRELFVDALVGHTYTYNKNFGVGEPCWAEEKPQLRGQLMGSNVSFPVLCIANFALIWDSVFPEMEFEDVQVLVNGDDCLFQTDEDGFAAWKDAAAAVGLSPSVGKTYFSRDFYVINSVMYDTHWGRTHLDVEGDDYIPYVNTGLLLGLKRSGGKSEGDDDVDKEWGGTLAQKWERIKLGFDHDFADQWMMDMEMRLAKDFEALNEISNYMPRRLSAEFGGLGLPGPWDDYDYEVGARVLMTNWKLRLKTKETHYSLMLRDLNRQYGTIQSRSKFSLGKALWATFGIESLEPAAPSELDEQWERFLSRPIPVSRACYREVFDDLSKSSRPAGNRPAVGFIDGDSRVHTEWDVFDNVYTPSHADHALLPPADGAYISPQRCNALLWESGYDEEFGHMWMGIG
jgi:hypothetical protein